MKANTAPLGTYPLAKLPHGEFIRLKADGPVYIRLSYDRTSKLYELQSANDINRIVYRKGSTLVIAGFTY